MYLKGCRVSGVGIVTSFRNLPKRLDPQVLEQLVIRLKKGDMTVANTIIEDHIGMALSIATKYNKANQGQDLVGEAMVALCESVHSFASRGRDNNITPYLSSTIYGKLADYLAAEDLVYIPKDEKNNLREKGELPVLYTEDSGDNIQEQINKVSMTEDDQTKLETEEIINKVTLSVIEAKVFELKFENVDDVTIAKLVGKTKARIGQIKELVRKKFQLHLFLQELYSLEPTSDQEIHESYYLGLS